MKNIMAVFGTRPEAIKMCPVIKELRRRAGVRVSVCLTGQHRSMLMGVLDTFGITPDHDLAIMREGQSLSYITARILELLPTILDLEKPHAVLVHGDTSSAFAAALTCFYRQIPVCHVEAGLRTYDLLSPFPEEFNRRSISLIAKYHFAPTALAAENLIREGVPEDRVFVTGNTAIDALKFTVRDDYHHPLLDTVGDRRLILITAHRRENLGKPIESMLRAIRRVIDLHPDTVAIYPVHMNPILQEAARNILGGSDRIFILPPLNVTDFHNLLARCFLVLTDSGGIQEEAPALGKPVLVMRGSTERPEGVASGALLTVGTDEADIYENFSRLLDSSPVHDSMSRARNPYGDGSASKKIADILEKG